MAAFTVIGSNWAQVFPFRPTHQLHDPEREEQKQQGTLEKTSSVTQGNLCHWSRRDVHNRAKFWLFCPSSQSDLHIVLKAYVLMHFPRPSQ